MSTDTYLVITAECQKPQFPICKFNKEIGMHYTKRFDSKEAALEQAEKFSPVQVWEDDGKGGEMKLVFERPFPVFSPGLVCQLDKKSLQKMFRA